MHWSPSQHRVPPHFLFGCFGHGNVPHFGPFTFFLHLQSGGLCWRRHFWFGGQQALPHGGEVVGQHSATEPSSKQVFPSLALQHTPSQQNPFEQQPVPHSLPAVQHDSSGVHIKGGTQQLSPHTSEFGQHVPVELTQVSPSPQHSPVFPHGCTHLQSGTQSQAGGPGQHCVWSLPLAWNMQQPVQSKGQH
jgi:hypothetical protein